MMNGMRSMGPTATIVGFGLFAIVIIPIFM